MDNWNRALRHGRIDPLNFAPYPKNPLLAHFFVNIGRADQLGSGVRNLYRYTKIYSGGEPELIEGDVFKTIVPLNLSTTRNDSKVVEKLEVVDKVVDKSKICDKMADIRISVAGEFLKELMPYFNENEWLDTATVCKIVNRPPTTVKRYLRKLIETGMLEAQGANKNRQYRLLTVELLELSSTQSTKY